MKIRLGDLEGPRTDFYLPFKLRSLPVTLSWNLAEDTSPESQTKNFITPGTYLYENVICNLKLKFNLTSCPFTC